MFGSAAAAPQRRPRHLAAKVIGGAAVAPLFVLLACGPSRLDCRLGVSRIAHGGAGGSALYVWRKNPELVRRRGEVGEGTQSWDILVLGLFGVSYCAVLVVAPLDAVRYRWSTMSTWLWPLGAVMYLTGVLGVTWAMVANTHFEKFVRIQKDRGHQVVDTGPYRIIRHPGYAAALLSLPLATPLLLGFWWACVPAVVAALCLAVRTALEDRFLQAELAGYQDYARRVPYRLLPRIW